MMEFPRTSERQRHRRPVSSSTSDSRFAPLQSDPKYRLPSKKHTHVTLDSRFSRMLKDDEFSQKARVDRYGREIPKGQGKKELQRFYRVAEDEGDQSGEDDEVVQRELKRLAGYDPARQGGFSTSEEESSEEEADSDEVDADVDADDGTNELLQETGQHVPMGEASKRIAVVNLDWDNIRAIDLMAVAESFAPADGKIEKVSIYPSEFGRERIEREEMEGPPKEIFASRKDEDGEDGEDEQDVEEDSDEGIDRIRKKLLKNDGGAEFDSSALRSYQLQRLRYYYAVIACSSTSTAKTLYDDMDGREYLTTANFFDLRFIPDDVSFDGDKPRDECTSVPDGYRPNEFVTEALTHSKVKLTWDADDATRKEVQKRAFSRGEIEDADLAAYIGSDSDYDQGDEQDGGAEVIDSMNGHINGMKSDAAEPSKRELEKQKMRAALGLPTSSAAKTSSKKAQKHGPVGDVQVTFSSGLSANPKRGPVFENEPIKVETTVEKYIRKEKERKAKRKARAKAVRDGEDPETVEDDKADLTSTSSETERADGEEKKKPNKDADPFDDPFFADPEKSNAAAKKAAKQAKKAERATREADDAAKRAELELLMNDDDEGTGRGQFQHFDMKDVLKREKEEKRKGRKGKKESKRNMGIAEDAEDAAGGLRPGSQAENFAVDVSDPRFSRLFSSHEFAIDPTNPRFQATKGMRRLLEEGRKKRKAEVGERDEIGPVNGGGQGKKRRKNDGRDEDGGSGAGAGATGDRRSRS